MITIEHYKYVKGGPQNKTQIKAMNNLYSAIHAGFNFRSSTQNKINKLANKDYKSLTKAEKEYLQNATTKSGLLGLATSYTDINGKRRSVDQGKRMSTRIGKNVMEVNNILDDLDLSIKVVDESMKLLENPGGFITKKSKGLLLDTAKGMADFILPGSSKIIDVAIVVKDLLTEQEEKTKTKAKTITKTTEVEFPEAPWLEGIEPKQVEVIGQETEEEKDQVELSDYKEKETVTVEEKVTTKAKEAKEKQEKVKNLDYVEWLIGMISEAKTLYYVESMSGVESEIDYIDDGSFITVDVSDLSNEAIAWIEKNLTANSEEDHKKIMAYYNTHTAEMVQAEYSMATQPMYTDNPDLVRGRYEHFVSWIMHF